MLSPISSWISFLQKQKPDYRFDKATAIRFLQLTCNFGNPAIPIGTRGFPSHDCSWFGFIDYVWFKILLLY